MADMRLIVAGAGGRMGRTLVKAIAETKGLTLAGARFLVVAVTRQDVAADASVFEAPDGVRFVLIPARTRQQADAQAAGLGQDARVFAVRPYWGLPATEWIEADPDFWKSNPLANRK
jgi:nucleoside-diphosphate-sugar epimerase